MLELSALKKKVVHFIPNNLLNYVPARVLSLNAEWPMNIIVEPTNVCNLTCPVCPTFLEMDRPKGFMTYEMFKFIIDDIKDKILHIAMNFAGEPTLNKDLWRSVKYAQAQGIKTYVSTNSTLITKQVKAILDSGLDHLVVCLDGASKDVHERYRRQSNFEIICQGIKLICQQKKKQGLREPHINLQFVVMAHNEHQIPSIIKLGRELGVDSLSLKSMSLGSSSMTDEERIERARKWLPINDKYNRYYIAQNKIFRREVPKLCHWYKSAVIYWNGDVGMCCYDFRGLNVFGNIFKDGGFAKIYKSPMWSKVQKKVMFKQFELCKRCNLTTFEGETILYNENNR